MSCKGLHCPGCGGHGSGRVLVIIAGGVIAFAAFGSAGVTRAASDAVTALVIAGASAVTLALTVLVLVLVIRARRAVLTSSPNSATRVRVRVGQQSIPARVTIRRSAAADQLPERPESDARALPAESWSHFTRSAGRAPARRDAR